MARLVDRVELFKACARRTDHSPLSGAEGQFQARVYDVQAMGVEGANADKWIRVRKKRRGAATFDKS